jgi:hypothetical protein
MWKALGIGTSWIVLVAAPHLSQRAEDPSDDPPASVTEPARALSGSFATVHFLEARFIVDGQEMPTFTNLKPGADVVIFSARVAPGRHVANVRLVYRGKSRGPFTYMRDYKLTVNAEEVLDVPRERAEIFSLVAKENRGMRVPLGKQLGIERRDTTPPLPAAPTN